MNKGKHPDDLLKLLAESQSQTGSFTPTQKFLHFYRELRQRADIDSLPEPEYAQLFEEIAKLAGFDDPLDALEALSQLPARRSGSRAA